jgi:hypothetical protein
MIPPTPREKKSPPNQTKPNQNKPKQTKTNRNVPLEFRVAVNRVLVKLGLSYRYLSTNDQTSNFVFLGCKPQFKIILVVKVDVQSSVMYGLLGPESAPDLGGAACGTTGMGRAPSES